MIAPEILSKYQLLYSRFLVGDIRTQLGMAATEGEEPLTGTDYRFLLSVSSRLALGGEFATEVETAKWKLMAYDAATRLANFRHAEGTWLTAADLILARLGNFPGRQLLKKSKGDVLAVCPYPTLLQLEAATRETENTVALSNGHQITLTDFQCRLFDSLITRKALSVSAPTSAGKSYVLAIDIIRRLLAQPTGAIVYLVPTRALIRQVMLDLLRHLRENQLEGAEVICAPTPVDADQLNHGVVYVLTQERLLSLLYSQEGPPPIAALFVDEAQELGDDERGMVLHSAIQRALERSPAMEVFFCSPLTSNPGFLLSEFGIDRNGEFFTEPNSPVSQTLITLSEVKGKARKVKIEVLTPTGLKEVGIREVAFEFRGVIPRLARVAHAFTQDGDASILYANGPSDAEDLADELAKLVPMPDEVDPEILDLVDFMRTHVHRQYALIDYLPKGIAFHYGHMPHIIRSRIEDMIRDRKLRFVCCTSTLLQGVNLPAKNIFIQNPKRGRGKPMSSSAFWNLAGRAGRLREVFSGNVWCVSADKWDENPLKGERLSQLSSSFREALTNETACASILDRAGNSQTASDGSLAEQAFGKVYAEFVLRGQRLTESQYAGPTNANRLHDIDEKCLAAQPLIKLPTDVCLRNATISPWLLDNLRRVFETEHDIRNLVPIDPRQQGALDRMRSIFGIIEYVFLKTGQDRWKYYVTLAYFWIRGSTLSELITNKLNYYRVGTDKPKVNKEIRELLFALENVLHFTYVKYLRAYNDVLAAVLQQKGETDLANKLPPLHLYIEFGAQDATLINLMSIGLSRTTAILLQRATWWPADLSRADCLSRLAALNLASVGVPQVCKREIADLRGS